MDDPVADGDAERALRIGWTQVVRLVHDQQDRPALLAPRPQVIEHGQGDGQLFVGSRERAQVQDGGSRSAGDDVRGRFGVERPRQPVEQPEVLDTLCQRFTVCTSDGSHPSGDVRRVDSLERRRQPDQRVVLPPIDHGIES